MVSAATLPLTSVQLLISPTTGHCAATDPPKLCRKRRNPRDLNSVFVQSPVFTALEYHKVSALIPKSSQDSNWGLFKSLVVASMWANFRSELFHHRKRECCHRHGVREDLVEPESQHGCDVVRPDAYISHHTSHILGHVLTQAQEVASYC